MSADIIINDQSVKEMDPFILLSLINTKLRNESDSLSGLCENYDIDQAQLVEKLGDFGYEYIGEINQFRLP
ncbi:MAG: DUF4250 domain-containing protein [Clostridiaceae bacterium]